MDEFLMCILLRNSK